MPTGRVLFAGEKQQYEDSVRRAAKEHIKDGDIFQIVLARSTRIECPDPVKLYRKLSSINPSPYTYLFEMGDLAIVGASPETLFNTYDRKLQRQSHCRHLSQGKDARRGRQVCKDHAG